MDEETRLKQRDHLYVVELCVSIPLNHGDSLKEATKGYFTDLNATRRHGGKTWIAPNVMIREDVSFFCSVMVFVRWMSLLRKHFISRTYQVLG